MQNEVLNKIAHTRAAGAVKRCHVMRILGEYNNAMHQWNTTMLLWYLFPEKFTKLAPYCLSHNIGEVVMGDIPATVKWSLGETVNQIEKIEEETIGYLGFPTCSELEYDDLKIVKACDSLELYLFCLEQLQMGNMLVFGCKENLEAHFRTGWLPTIALDFYYSLVQGGLPLSTQESGGKRLRTVKV